MLVFAVQRLASHPLSPSEAVSEVPWFQPLPLGIKTASTKQHLLIWLNNIIQPFFPYTLKTSGSLKHPPVLRNVQVCGRKTESEEFKL